ncbi:hypothetical protein B0H34DRAFT_641772, partial [Crassisporium funariophilum]
ICSFPAEILSAIFESGKSMEDDSFQEKGAVDGRGHDVPFEILVSYTCPLFTKVALATPRLWTSINIDAHRPRASVAVYLVRSGSCWLDIRIDQAVHNIQMGDIAMNEMLDLILPHSHRWRSLSIGYGCERINHPIVMRLCDRAAPGLQHISIAVDDVDFVNVNIADGDVTLPHIFRECTSRLKFVRLRGLAMHFFRPPLNHVVTLHLDQTRSVPILYNTFCEMVTCSPVLAHLSIYGDIIAPAPWPREANIIRLASLRSLRICGIAGDIYAGILMGIDAPLLESLTLKDVQSHDLDALWKRDGIVHSRYASIQALLFLDFDLSVLACERVFQTFQDVINFSTFHSYIRESCVVDLLLRGAIEGQAGSQVRWPKLQILSFPFDYYGDDEEVAEVVMEARKACGYPLAKIMLRATLEEVQEMELEDKDSIIEAKFFWETEVWPANRTNLDHDDTLF